MAWPCSSLSVCSSLKPYCRHSRSILRKRLKLGNHWYALSRFRFRLLTSCWCCSLIRLSSLAWLSFIFCISVRRLSIWSFKFSTSLCSWAFSFPVLPFSVFPAVAKCWPASPRLVQSGSDNTHAWIYVAPLSL